MHHLESLKGKKTWLWHETPNPEESKKWDWSYKCRNEDIIRITKTTRISSFTEKQYLKFITGTTRLEDNSFQTRTLIGVYWANSESMWKKLYPNHTSKVAFRLWEI